MDARQRTFAARITAAFPALTITTMEEQPHLGWGGDSDAWLVNGDLIVRFPRTAEMAAQLGVEACVLPQLAPTLPLAVPAFSYVARAAPDAPPQFVGYPLIRGEALTPALLDELGCDESERAASAARLGDFLARLHDFPLEQAWACGVAKAPRGPEGTRAFYERVREQVFPLLSPPLRVWTDHLFGDALARPGLWEYTPTLVHGDLSSDHILFDHATRAIAGIIDFGDMGEGDPVGDFVGLAAYGEAFLADALAAYAVPERLGPLARSRLTFYRQRLPFIALAWGAELGDDRALAEGRTLLQAVLAAGTQG